MAHDLLCYLSLFAYSDDEHFGLFDVFMFWKLQLFYNTQNGSTPLIYLILFPQQPKVRLFIPFEMAMILLFHSVDFP